MWVKDILMTIFYPHTRIHHHEESWVKDILMTCNYRQWGDLRNSIPNHTMTHTHTHTQPGSPGSNHSAIATVAAVIVCEVTGCVCVGVWVCATTVLNRGKPLCWK